MPPQSMSRVPKHFHHQPLFNACAKPHHCDTVALILKKPDSAFDRFPCKMSPRHVPGVKTRIPQRRSCLASDVEAVDTKRDDRLGF
jgi:hypothetical protein